MIWFRRAKISAGPAARGRRGGDDPVELGGGLLLGERPGGQLAGHDADLLLGRIGPVSGQAGRGEPLLGCGGEVVDPPLGGRQPPTVTVRGASARGPGGLARARVRSTGRIEITYLYTRRSNVVL